ncbi:MAG: GDSL-type esterase/lipase family protein, partial [Candidatus Neomarinimicrobiota bacterium]|nr:GDSL-type esterase/lipase family protein [Candidatus Neomarinimicrobiota bacterium]
RLDEIIYYKPIAVFLLIGINDIFNADIPDRGKITPSYVSENILKIADQIADQSPSIKIFIQTILPVNHEIYTEINGMFPDHAVPLPVQINQINSLIKNNDLGNKYTIIDLHSAFVDEHGLMNGAYSTDGVHLNDAGYQVWVEYVGKYVQSLAINRDAVD